MWSRMMVYANLEDLYDQIDHVVIDGRYVSNVLDVRQFRGPNMDSAHFLVAAKARMRISTSRAVPQRKLDVKKLRSQRTAESFSAQLSDKLRQPQSSPDDIGGLPVRVGKNRL